MRTTVLGTVIGTITALAGLAVTASGAALVASRPGGAISDSINQSENLVRVYNKHITTLANPFFEGRAPGLPGIEHAAAYIEWYFRQAGLEPAFPVVEEGVGALPELSYRQTFRATTQTVATRQFALATGKDGKSITLTPGKDFNPLSGSGNAVAAGPVAFVGYSIPSGPDGYSSFAEGDSLDGKIALILRFEPMNDEGGSRFSDDGRWTGAASLQPKLTAAVERGAEAIVMVSPPGTTDPRALELPALNSFRGLPQLEVPLIYASMEAVDEMLAGTGMTLEQLRKQADKAGGVTDLPVNMTVAVELERQPVLTDNVGAILRGHGDLADEYVIIGAHYDHLGYGFFGSRAGGAGAGVLHPGADDNASGTAGLLLLAQTLAEEYAQMGDTPRRSIFFQAYSAEEMGLIGARYYVQNPIAPVENHFAMINLDMIGWLRNDQLEIYGTGTAREFDGMIDAFNSDNAFSIKRIPGGSGPSDHAPFFAAGIPVLFFHTGLNAVYHLPTDVADLINREGAVKVSQFAGRFAVAMATMDDLEFVNSGRGNVDRNRPMDRVQVRFGIAPGDYSGSEPGVLIGDVYPGTSAAQAGLQAGDLIMSWNGVRLSDVESWMPLLSQHKPGDKVEIVFRRDGRQQRTTATLQARQEEG